MCSFHWEDVEQRGSGGVKRVHSQLLTPEAPEGKFDRLPVNQLHLYGTLPCLSAQHKTRAAGVSVSVDMTGRSLICSSVNG